MQYTIGMDGQENSWSQAVGGSTIHAPQELQHDPVPNTIAEKVGPLMKAVGLVTRESKHFSSLSDREQARELFKQIKENRGNLKKLDKDSDKYKAVEEKNNQLFLELKDRGKINKEYLRQGRVDVEMGELGVQSSSYVIMEPPEHLRDQRYKDTPVVCIPGISNSLAGFETLIKELVYQGRTVIAIDQPESTNGVVTEEFAKAAEASTQLEPHVAYYNQAIRLALNQRLKNIDDPEARPIEVTFDLLGHSTGCAITAGLLADEFFQAATQNAVMISPAGVVEQTIKEFDDATYPELFSFVKNKSRISRYSRDNNPQPPIKAKATEAVKQNIIHPLYDLYRGAQLGNGRKILVLSGEEDEIVKSNKADVGKLNPKGNQEWLTMPHAAHAEALVNPASVVEKIKEYWEK